MIQRVCFVLLLWWVPGQTAAGNPSPLAEFDALADDYVAAYRALDLPPLHLALMDNLKAVGTARDLRRQRSVLSAWAPRLAAVDPQPLDVCRRVELARLQSDRTIAFARATLALEWRAAQPQWQAADNVDITQLAWGTRWYRWLLYRWLGDQVDADDMLRLGQRDLARAQSAYRKLQAALGYANDDEGLREHLATTVATGGDTQQLTRVFEKHQTTVHEHLPGYFHEHNVTPVNIARAERADFAVPGWYDSATRTFHYNVLNNQFDRRQADWLFLHEATPGHHFQVQAHANGKCESRLGRFGSPAFLEGWGAYVETQGEALGLYTDDEARLAAVEWDLVRSARVVLDVRLNRDGWSDTEAHAFWAQNAHGQAAIAQREISRMRRWPAQVITYKYGADKFALEREKFMLHDGADVRDFHALALRYGPMPWQMFSKLVDEAAAQH